VSQTRNLSVTSPILYFHTTTTYENITLSLSKDFFTVPPTSPSCICYMCHLNLHCLLFVYDKTEGFCCILQLLRIVRENAVVIVVGETGSGKTTQLTQVSKL